MARISEQVEWLSLVDISGPFLAVSVLEEAFPQGLEKVETPRRQRLRAGYEEWRDAVDDDDPLLDELHAAWIRMVLKALLEYEDAVLIAREDLGGQVLYRDPDQGIEVMPDYAVRGDDGKCRLLIAIHPPETDLEKPLPSNRWATSPVERMTLLCRGNAVRLGLVTNGERWMLVNAPIGGTSGHLSWLARLWWQEPITLKAFQSLFGVRRCFGPPEETLEQLLERSIAFQEEVTDTLGEQVRRAVEVLIQALGRADQDRNGELLKDVTPAELYEAGLTVMMRLVFILCAEERGLLLLGDSVYDQNYAISTLRAKLQEDADRYGVEVLERRHDAWSRMLAVFRAVYAGIEHEGLRMPALGGSLFDPDRFPFLEGRARGARWRDEPTSPIPIDNRTVLMLLEALQILEQRGGARLLSYRALDVEQIGHVYEGLLEYAVIELPDVTVGLIGSKDVCHPTIGLSELEASMAEGPRAVAEKLTDLTGRSVSAIENALRNGGIDAALLKLIQACGGDETLARRILPFAWLIRTDSWGSPLVYRTGSFAITRGTDRRETGTHYTPRSLTESIVEETLTPIVYMGPSEGKPREQWKLRTPAELLELKICDPAMGSGAFLVQVCRFLAERLVEAWALEEDAGRVISVDGVVLDDAGGHELLPKDLDERLLIARRLIAEKCLYGVDSNPLAVELAKLSIWLVTMAKGRPFGFLDHNLRCGDSLLGVHRLDQITRLETNPSSGPMQRGLFGQSIEAAVEKAIDLRKRLRAIPIRDIRDVEAMARLDGESRHVLDRPILVADAFIGEALRTGANDRSLNAALRSLAMEADRIARGDEDAVEATRRRANEALALNLPTGKPVRRPFHWPLEFPEVFVRENGGFDAIIGNPPFLGGQRITGALGTAYREYLVQMLAGGARGSADLVAYFFLRAYELLRRGGNFGLLAVNTIAEGDTRQVGLEWMVQAEAVIYSAYPNEPWPGQAAVVISRVHVRKGAWNGVRTLAGRSVPFISAFLSDQEEWTPKRLKANEGIAFQGSIVLGLGFTLGEAEARAFIDRDPKNAEVLFPYLNGEDLNSDPEQRASRWVINFWDWPLARDAEGRWERANERQRSAWLREGHVPADYPGRVAEDFPELLAIVREKVKPERDQNRDRLAREKWWLHLRPRPELYHAIGRGHAFCRHPEGWDESYVPLSGVFVLSRVTKFIAPAFCPNKQIWADRIVVFATDDYALFAVLVSSLHEVWVRKNASTFETRLTYTPSDAFETMPLPNSLPVYLRKLGARFNEFRTEIMCSSQFGLTDFYNNIHDPDNVDPGFETLRQLHRQIDETIAIAYGWDDLDLGHDFHEVPYLPDNDSLRYTISEPARLEVLRRLAVLNRERYEDEVGGGCTVGPCPGLQAAPEAPEL